MAFTLKNRVKDTTTTTGTGTLTLSGSAPAGYQAFSAIGNGNSCPYTIVGGSEWEVGIGTYSSSGTTLSRDTVLASSNSGSLVSFSAGTKDVFVTLPAQLVGYQLISTVTPTGTGTVDFDPIPQTYSDLLIIVDGISHDSGSSQYCRWSVKDETTWRGSSSFDGGLRAAGVSLYASIFLYGYRLDKCFGEAYFSTSNPWSSEGIFGLSNGADVATAWRCDGGIQGLRFAWDAGNFDAGTLSLYGKV